MTGQSNLHNIDLSEIALKEHYKLNILARFGGKIKYYLKVAAFCNKVKNHYRLRQFFEDYDLKELNRCLVDILNTAFQELPESFDLNAHFQERHQKLFDAGMTSSHFDTLVVVYEETLWDTAIDESLVTDTVRLLHSLRDVFDNIEESNRSNYAAQQESLSSEEFNKYNGLSLWELVEQRKQEKIESRRRRSTIKSKKKKEKKLPTNHKSKSNSTTLEESRRSDSTEDTTILSSEELYDMNWQNAGYQGWNSMVLD